jgi:hypothetical protein
MSAANLAEAELFAHGFGIGPLECRAARGILFATKNGTALLEAGDKLLQEFVFHRGCLLLATYAITDQVDRGVRF